MYFSLPITPYDGIYPVHRPVFPALYLRKDTVRYAAYGLCRYAAAELLLKDVAYLSCAVADGVQAYDSVRKRIRKDLLPFAYNLEVESAVTVARCVYGHFAHRGLYLLAHVTVAAVAKLAFVSFQMAVHFPFQGALSRFSNKGANTPSLPDRGTPTFNCSMVFALKCSKSNELLIIKVCL